MTPKQRSEDKYTRDDVVALLERLQEKVAHDDVIKELRSLNRDWLLKIFSDMLVDSDLDLRDMAIKALMAVDPHRGVDIILPSLNDSLESWRWYVCGALADYGDERVISPLTQVLLYDSDGDTRYMAALALEKIGDNRALPALRYAQEHDKGTDYEGRRIDRMAKEAIQAITERSSSKQSPDENL